MWLGMMCCFLSVLFWSFAWPGFFFVSTNFSITPLLLVYTLWQVSIILYTTKDVKAFSRLSKQPEKEANAPLIYRYDEVPT
jgi:hypothetical protein